MELNNKQKRAIESNEDYILVLSSAGSGKTTALTQRVKRMLEDGVNPEDILVITFTNKAGKELEERLGGEIKASTFHQLGLAKSREFIDSSLAPIDQDDQLNIIEELLKEFPEIKRKAKFLQNWINNLKSSFVYNIKIETKHDVYLEEFLKAYHQKLTAMWLMDFNDMLRNLYNLASNGKIKYKYVLLDECQDSTLEQYKIVKALHSKSIFMVGDIRQSIYGFNGARPENIREFVDEYSPEIIHMDTNYRCSQKIVRWSNNLISHQNDNLITPANHSRKEKGKIAVRETTDLEQSVVDAVKGLGYKSTFVLTRNNDTANRVLEALKRNGIPAKEKHSLIVPNELKDVRMMLELSEVPTNEFLLEWYVSKKMPEYVDKVRGKIKGILKGHITCPPKIKKSITELISGVVSSEAGKKEVYAQACKLDLTPEKKELLKAVYKIVKDGSVLEFDGACEVVQRELDEKEEGAVVMTFHKSKGLEADNVIIAGAEQGVIPQERDETSHASLKEARSLFYVAATRAKDNLLILYRDTWKDFRMRNIPGEPSRFVAEMKTPAKIEN